MPGITSLSFSICISISLSNFTACIPPRIACDTELRGGSVCSQMQLPCQNRKPAFRFALHGADSLRHERIFQRKIEAA
jgi:hypothetical protein